MGLAKALGLNTLHEQRFSVNEPSHERTNVLQMRKQRRRSASRFADQLRGNREADQRLYFRYIDSTIPLLSQSEISSL